MPKYIIHPGYIVTFHLDGNPAQKGVGEVITAYANGRPGLALIELYANCKEMKEGERLLIDTNEIDQVFIR